MNILSTLFRKKFFSCIHSRRYISFKIRKSLCYRLSDMEIDENGVNVMTVSGFKSTKMNKCTKFEITVVNNGSMESSSIALSTGSLIYLFNCGENNIRARTEFKLKSNTVHGIFITSTHVRHFGGVISTLLSPRCNSEELFLFGPPNIKEIISAAQNQCFLKPLFLRVMTDSSTQIFDNGMMKVKLVRLCHELSEEKRRSTAADMEDEYVLNYICQSDDFGIHLDVEACKKKNVPVGPLLNKLKSKNDVTLENGEVVQWKDVCYYTSQGPVNIIFADCPSVGYLDSLLNEKEFISYQSSGETPAALVIHFTPPEVMKTVKYRKWMSLFRPSTNHLIVNEDNRAVNLIALHYFQKKMNYVCPSVFPNLYEAGVPILKQEQSLMAQKGNFSLYTCRDEEKEKAISYDSNNYSLFPARVALESMPGIFHDIDGINVVRAIPSLTHVVHPSKSYEWHFISSLHFSSILNELSVSKELEAELAEFKNFEKNWTSSDESAERPEYPKLLFLGTGSGEPAKNRGPSGIMLYLNPDEIILFDCGEGTYLQMCLLFGPDKMSDVLQKIKLIFISHFHVDHHFGLLTLLSKRQNILNGNGAGAEKRLVLLLPNEVQNWLRAMNVIYMPILQYVTVFSNEKFTSICGEVKRYLNNTELKDINLCYVVHCYKAWGISVTLKNGYKITYSGDTMPSDNLVKLGENSNILIHESTFDDTLEKMALDKRHSTSSQAIAMGVKMKAKYVILTHFSQRYYRCPQLNFEQIPKNVGIAFDFMIANEKSLPLLTKLNSIYGKLFEDEILHLTKQSRKRYRQPMFETENGERENYEEATQKRKKRI